MSNVRPDPGGALADPYHPYKARPRDVDGCVCQPIMLLLQFHSESPSQVIVRILEDVKHVSNRE